MKYLRPLIFRPKYFDHIESEINWLLDQLIYDPLQKLLQGEHNEIKNDKNQIVAFIRSGKIHFDGKIFTGEGSAKISRAMREMGARFDKRRKGWYFETIPAEIKSAAAIAKVNFQKLTDNILQTLDNVDVDMIDHASFKERYETSLDMMDSDLDDTLKHISIPMQFTPAMKANIAQAWSQNLKLYIKKWTGENIIKLREEVLLNAQSGQRAGNLVNLIQANYGVSKSKAKFLARQETSLLMSKFREERYKDGGISKYKWAGVMDERERPDHKLLENKIFNWNSPPIVDRKSGRRGHPGEDFNCRCIAVPVLDF